MSTAAVRSTTRLSCKPGYQTLRIFSPPKSLHRWQYDKWIVISLRQNPTVERKLHTSANPPTCLRSNTAKWLKSYNSVNALSLRQTRFERVAVRLSHGLASHLPFPVFRDVPSLRQLRKELFKGGQSVGFVPTMGALHDGHMSLVSHALQENSDVFVSIFVNPTQFGVNEDLDSYPKTWEADMQRLIEIHQKFQGSNSRIVGVFAPNVKVMYPTLPPSSELDGQGSFVTISPLGKWLEGETRPVFFRGVATVCTKLFNITQPDKVYFGQKDIQQSVLIKRMVQDFHIPTEVRVIPTSREPDGLAMSSRNVYLGHRRRQDVGVLARSLLHSADQYSNGELSAGELRQAAFSIFGKELNHRNGAYHGCEKIDIVYISLNNIDDMTSIEDTQQLDPMKGAILSAAIKVWPVDQPQNEEETAQLPVRLVDNVILQPRSHQ